MDAKAELDALEAEANELTEKLKLAETRWAETVRTQGEETASQNGDLHEIRNRLQIIQARSFKLKRELQESR
ncbi:hypothetical protein NGM99_04295 [Mesorhizobium sp. RP14(2022)]|uniref:Uncharacterized protein n=1 Tax=Mesorhizobium liriopis TaxID=2953882 RepID=A0ABT1C471_9HYPH|nr:hypothetical protein [Mesorhizobium liriopis]MCO6049010.1 hypothetical protein [Mesorhizobium liriopis]